MSAYYDIKKVKIVFFSGTGNTAIVTNTFQKFLEAQGKYVIKYELDKRNSITDDKEDLLIIIYPVHACNSPEPVYEFINAIPAVNKKLTVVISVSGGGEITPNNACRLHCIKRLEKKGYNVIYEKMIVMPSNWMVPTADVLAVRLLEILPHKIEKIVNDLLSGVSRRTKPGILNRFLSCVGEFEKYCTRFFGKSMKVNHNCKGCGLCEKACPRANIALVNGRPVFFNDCVLCLKCIYGCPQKALTPGMGKFVIIKQGYNLEYIENLVGKIKIGSIEELAKGYLWKGVKEYLLDDK